MKKKLLIIQIKEIVLIPEGVKLTDGGWYGGHQYYKGKLGNGPGIIIAKDKGGKIVSMGPSEKEIVKKMTFEDKWKLIKTLLQNIIFT